MQIKDIKKFFPWFEKNKNYVYIDSAATTLKPKIVIDEIVKYYEEEGTNPHNTDSKFTMNIFNKIENARKNIANFINADIEEVAFNSGATEGLNLIANGLKKTLKKGDEILLTYAEHASNILPWMSIAKELNVKIKYAGDKFKELTKQDFINSINENVKIISFSTGHNLTGKYFPEYEICQHIKKKYPHIFIVIDATQSIQHHKVDVKKNNCDFLVCSAHKIFGPTGVGLTYIKKEHQKFLNPIRYGGGMNLSIDENSFEELLNIHKYEGGTQNIAGILGWSKAVDFINEIGYDQIESYEQELYEYAYKKMSSIDNLIIYNNPHDISSTISFNYKGVFCQDLSSYLGSKKIIVRSGLSCAKLYCNILDTKALVRASFYIYNTKEDVDYLYSTLKNFKKGDELNEFF